MTIRPIINVRDDKLSRGFLSAVKFCHEISNNMPTFSYLKYVE